MARHRLQASSDHALVRPFPHDRYTDGSHRSLKDTRGTVFPSFDDNSIVSSSLSLTQNTSLVDLNMWNVTNTLVLVFSSILMLIEGNQLHRSSQVTAPMSPTSSSSLRKR